MPGLRELFKDHRVGNKVQVQAAVLFGNHHPEQAHLFQAFNDLGWVAVGGFPFGSYGLDLLSHKVANRVAEEALFFGEFEIHRQAPFKG